MTDPLASWAFGVALLVMVAGLGFLLTVHRAAIGIGGRGAGGGLPLREMAGSDAAWLAGHRAADRAATRALGVLAVPVVAGVVLTMVWPLVGLLVELVAAAAALVCAAWLVRLARQAAVDADEH